MRKIVLFLGVFCVLITACENNGGTITNPLPEFIQVSGPQLFDGSTTDVNYKEITATIDTKEATAFTVGLKYWINDESDSTVGQIIDDCIEQDGDLECAYKFTNGLTVYPPGVFFEDDSTVSYQWYVYSTSPDLPDAILAESEVISFTIVAPESCVLSDECPNNFSCTSDLRRPLPVEEECVLGLPFFCEGGYNLYHMVCALPPFD